MALGEALTAVVSWAGLVGSDVSLLRDGGGGGMGRCSAVGVDGN